MSLMIVRWHPFRPPPPRTQKIDLSLARSADAGKFTWNLIVKCKRPLADCIFMVILSGSVLPRLFCYPSNMKIGNVIYLESCLHELGVNSLDKMAADKLQIVVSCFQYSLSGLSVFTRRRAIIVLQDIFWSSSAPLSEPLFCNTLSKLFSEVIYVSIVTPRNQCYQVASLARQTPLLAFWIRA